MFLGSFEHLAAPWAASRWLRQWGGRSPHVQVSYACVNSSIHPSYILWTSRYTRRTSTATCILLPLLALSMHQFDLHMCLLVLAKYTFMCLLVLAKYTFNQSQNISLTVQVLNAVHTMHFMHTMHTMPTIQESRVFFSIGLFTISPTSTAETLTCGTLTDVLL